MTLLGKRTPEHSINDEVPRKQREIEGNEESFSIIPMLSMDTCCEEVPTQLFHVLEVKDMKKIGDILKILPPIPDQFSHLKRIKNGRVLICPCYEELSEELLSNISSVETTTSIVQMEVPSVKPITEKQFKWSKERWPSSFHSNKELESILNGTFFSPFIHLIQRFRERAMDVGCVIVKDGEEIASGSRGKGLLEHACIQSVSTLSLSSNNDYLATGCDVYIDTEPCAMCAMALVHVRAKRVFFCRRSSNGVLGDGHWQLHLVPVINHHYQVFQLRDKEGEEREKKTDKEIGKRLCGMD